MAPPAENLHQEAPGHPPVTSAGLDPQGGDVPYGDNCSSVFRLIPTKRDFYNSNQGAN